jgi:hypothetical protein
MKKRADDVSKRSKRKKRERNSPTLVQFPLFLFPFTILLGFEGRILRLLIERTIRRWFNEHQLDKKR